MREHENTVGALSRNLTSFNELHTSAAGEYSREKRACITTTLRIRVTSNDDSLPVCIGSVFSLKGIKMKPNGWSTITFIGSPRYRGPEVQLKVAISSTTLYWRSNSLACSFIQPELSGAKSLTHCATKKELSLSSNRTQRKSCAGVCLLKSTRNTTPYSAAC